MAIRFARTQMYAIIFTAVIIIATQTFETKPLVSVIFGILTIGLTFWWVAVITKAIKPVEIKE